MRHPALPWLMWSLPVLFFAYQFILRLWPGLMMQSIMSQFSIDAGQFGLLAACYYYGYAGMQIPVAILLERYGPCGILSLFALLCGAATLMFTYTHSFAIALLSRFLIGVGSAVGFLGTSKVISEWFPKEMYARMVGFSFTFGLLGAIYGGRPISMLIQTYNWQHVALVLSFVALLISLLTLVFLRSPVQAKAASRTHVFEWKHIRSTLSSPKLWGLACANLLMVGALEGFADVWGVPYLMEAYHLSKENSAGVMSLIFFGMLFGGPFLAYCSRKLTEYGVILICALGMCGIFVILLASHALSMSSLSILLFVTGLLCCYQVIIFAAGAKLVSLQELSVTVAFLNCVNMLGGSFFHTIIGKIMHAYWQGQAAENGLHLYSKNAFQHALVVIPICALLGALIILGLCYSQRVKPKVCR
jgi:MFS family permease